MKFKLAKSPELIFITGYLIQQIVCIKENSDDYPNYLFIIFSVRNQGGQSCPKSKPGNPPLSFFLSDSFSDFSSSKSTAVKNTV